MKLKIVSLITAMCLLCSVQAEAKGFWKKVGKFLGNVVEAAVVVGVDYMYDTYAPEAKAQYKQSMTQFNEQGGYSAETSITKTIATEVGIKQQNIQRGMAWTDAQNKYDRQNVVKDYIFDAAGEISGNPELFEKFRQISEAQNTYLSESSKAMTAEEKRAALDKRNLAYFDIGYDTYEEAQKRRAEHLAKKLEIQQKLTESGMYADAQIANEVAGSIIAIQKSNLSKQEKEALLSAYGFGNAQQLAQAVNEVMNDNYNANAEAERIKAEEEAKRQAELQRQEAERKAAEERKNAIQKLATTKIEVYDFDETALSPNQKSELDVVADILNRYSDIKVLIVGHTCNIGYKNINQKKGLKRAEASKEYLIEKGVVAERISVDSKGETQPFVQNVSSENRKQNRRIEFVIE